MSTPAANYTPDDSSVSDAPWPVVQLSQRDVSLQIPINFVTHPGISLTAACFGNKVYEDDDARKCISNLISTGFRRFEVDLFWSADQQKWTFCPVTVPSGAARSRRALISETSILPEALSYRQLDGMGFPGGLGNTAAKPRKANSFIGKLLGRRAAAVSQTPSSNGASTTSPVPIGVGSYTCTESIDVSLLVRLLAEYFTATQDTLNAHMLFIMLNMHAARSADNPDEPSHAPSAGNLPAGSQLLGSLFSAALDSYMYTPKQLNQERSNLNQSWYYVPRHQQPIAEYFTTHSNSKNILSTPDGWPCESYVEIERARRLLLGWGTVDKQMKDYDFNSDDEHIFARGSLSSSIKITTSDEDGTLDSGCLYNPNSTDLGDSWAQSIVTQQDPDDDIHSLCTELMSCGISPMINSTLHNKTADQDINLYRNATVSSVWSWAPGQPDPEDSSTLSHYRCALADISLRGHWRSAGCSEELYGACRIGNQPYGWTLTTERAEYADVGGYCPENSTLAVPRTGLENTYLYHYLLSQDKDKLDPDGGDESEHSVWLDLNSLDVSTCWVSGGPGAQCPYEVDENAVQRRAVLVPTVAAIIVLIITALTVFVKCSSNRRNSRRTRVIEGWEYEGVPS
ncbi:hypothetical protein FQN55_008067 [Onygenales sp. PD_40]|nr:hypothetical protein FQN55_008067 [Onygenales sp. PD_40]KAK2779494.1 hypothetical protein FQN52_002427 [Onygenales sp. PD_12]KAK2790290.1 hypothetical protein FQN53_000056 [Emmonsiellopsis sp. PD_33]KAK2806601.1 hypothetical protein FQN51_006567 [Onygenales sp. PD_10]